MLQHSKQMLSQVEICVAGCPKCGAFCDVIQPNSDLAHKQTQQIRKQTNE